jgi:hypothetical protein
VSLLEQSSIRHIIKVDLDAKIHVVNELYALHLVLKSALHFLVKCSVYFFRRAVLIESICCRILPFVLICSIDDLGEVVVLFFVFVSSVIMTMSAMVFRTVILKVLAGKT